MRPVGCRDRLSAAGELTLVTLLGIAASHLRAAHLPRLKRSGPLGELLARQCTVWARERHVAVLAREHGGLPDDLVNFHWDPVTCAVALGWSGASSQDVRVTMRIKNGVLRWERDPTGRRARVVTGLDARDFDERFMSAVEAAQR